MYGYLLKNIFLCCLVLRCRSLRPKKCLMPTTQDLSPLMADSASLSTECALSTLNMVIVDYEDIYSGETEAVLYLLSKQQLCGSLAISWKGFYGVFFIVIAYLVKVATPTTHLKKITPKPNFSAVVASKTSCSTIGRV